jgi:hypothetical protein
MLLTYYLLLKEDFDAGGFFLPFKCRKEREWVSKTHIHILCHHHGLFYGQSKSTTNQGIRTIFQQQLMLGTSQVKSTTISVSALFWNDPQVSCQPPPWQQSVEVAVASETSSAGDGSDIPRPEHSFPHNILFG